jgi:hypothetical protein
LCFLLSFVLYSSFVLLNPPLRQYFYVSGNTPKPYEQRHHNIAFPFLFLLICDLI